MVKLKESKMLETKIVANEDNALVTKLMLLFFSWHLIFAVKSTAFTKKTDLIAGIIGSWPENPEVYVGAFVVTIMLTWSFFSKKAWQACVGSFAYSCGVGTIAILAALKEFYTIFFLYIGFCLISLVMTAVFVKRLRDGNIRSD